MSKKNIKNFISYLDLLEFKTFNNIKNLKTSDQKILKRFIIIKDNLENLEKFNLSINQISKDIGCTEKLLVKKYKYFKKLNLI